MVHKASRCLAISCLSPTPAIGKRLLACKRQGESRGSLFDVCAEMNGEYGAENWRRDRIRIWDRRAWNRPKPVDITNAYGGMVGEYTTSGVPVNPALIDGLNFPVGIDVLGDSLFVVNVGNGTIGKYTTSGVPVNPSLVSGLRPWGGIAVVSAPVPDASSTWTLLLLGLTATFGLKPLLLRPA